MEGRSKKGKGKTVQTCVLFIDEIDMISSKDALKELLVLASQGHGDYNDDPKSSIIIIGMGNSHHFPIQMQCIQHVFRYIMIIITITTTIKVSLPNLFVN